LGVKQIGITDEEIILEVTEYKMSTKFWRQKYHNLCTDIEILVESIGEKIEEEEHQIDVDIILKRMREFIKKIEEFKANYNKLSKQVKSGQIYCKALILLRDKLCLQIKTLKEQNLKFSKNVESLEDKCFLQNKIIVVFEELFHQRNETSKLIERNNNLNNELKKYKTLMASVKNIDQIESTVKQSISGEEKAENSKVENQVICELKDILISETKLNSQNDSINKCCDCSHSSVTSFSTPEPESKKRRKVDKFIVNQTITSINLSLNEFNDFVSKIFHNIVLIYLYEKFKN
jgi:hypothetical protein